MTKQIQITSQLLENYRNNSISFEELATACSVSRPLLTRYFRQNNLQTNRDSKLASVNHSIFTSIDNEFSAYLLGYYVADGSIGILHSKYSECKRFSISASEQDTDHIKQIHSLICPNHALTVSKSKLNSNLSISKPMVKLTITSNQVFDDLTTLGFGERKTYSQLKLPQISDEYIWHFIRGYFDGDGTVGTSEGKKYKDKVYINSFWSIVSKTNTLLTDIQQFFNKFSIVSHTCYDKSRDVWYLRINKRKDIHNLRELMYKNANWYLQRKYGKFKGIPS